MFVLFIFLLSSFCCSCHLAVLAKFVLASEEAARRNFDIDGNLLSTKKPFH
jgi:hypothetical protein